MPPLPFADYALPKKNWNGLILVGEAPGAEEAKQGKPFVGRSGQLLDKMLDAAHIDRAETLIANVFRYQPPKNKVASFFASKKAAKEEGVELAETYGKFASVYCRATFAPELERLAILIEEKKPSLIVALGRTPLWALTGENELMKKVGTFLPCRLASGYKVLATYHPSFILRGNWKLQSAWQTHFETAAAQKTTQYPP